MTERSDFAPVYMSQGLVALFSDDEIDRLMAGERVELGAAVYRVCGRCRRVVRLNKPVVGGLHFCEASRRKR